VFAFAGVDPSFTSSRFEMLVHRSATKRYPTTLGRLVAQGWPLYRLPRPLMRRMQRALYRRQTVPRPQVSDSLDRALREYLAHDLRVFRRVAGEEFAGWPPRGGP
jgi:hypothetical protein